MPEITETCVSRAWLKAARLANASPRKEIRNLIVNIDQVSGRQLCETQNVRVSLDEAHEANENFSISTVASTIFPSSLWKQEMPRRELFDRYLKLWPRISKYRENRRGTYFQRLISYPSPCESPFNQLEFVISAFRSGIHRRSALQCGILAPQVDLNATPFQGFPCMQQVAFIPEGNNGLRITALYPMHYLWARAYGNYLGLIRLGQFMANEMNLDLQAMTCIALVAKLDEIGISRSFVEAMDEVR